MVGTWLGAGQIVYPSIDGQLLVAQELTISHDGRPFLIHTSKTWEVDSNGEKIRPRALETGFWRMSGVAQVELVLAHSTGIAEVWHGDLHVQYKNNDITQDFEMADVTLRNGSQRPESESIIQTKSAKVVTGGVRIYGMFKNKPDTIGWVYEMETGETPLTPHASFELSKVVAHES